VWDEIAYLFISFYTFVRYRGFYVDFLKFFEFLLVKIVENAEILIRWEKWRKYRLWRGWDLVIFEYTIYFQKYMKVYLKISGFNPSLVNFVAPFSPPDQTLKINFPKRPFHLSKSPNVPQKKLIILLTFFNSVIFVNCLPNSHKSTPNFKAQFLTLQRKERKTHFSIKLICQSYFLQ
jgi:hypothetical protein